VAEQHKDPAPAPLTPPFHQGNPARVLDRQEQYPDPGHNGQKQAGSRRVMPEPQGRENEDAHEICATLGKKGRRAGQETDAIGLEQSPPEQFPQLARAGGQGKTGEIDAQAGAPGRRTAQEMEVMLPAHEAQGVIDQGQGQQAQGHPRADAGQGGGNGVPTGPNGQGQVAQHGQNDGHQGEAQGAGGKEPGHAVPGFPWVPGGLQFGSAHWMMPPPRHTRDS